MLTSRFSLRTVRPTERRRPPRDSTALPDCFLDEISRDQDGATWPSTA